MKALAQAGALAALPVGSTEAHGPHLPLNVDVVIAEEVCRRVAERLHPARDVVVFPPIVYSLTEFAAPFSGTVTLPKETAQAHLVAVFTGIIAAGFRELLVVNHHLEPAHFALVHTAAKAVTDATGARVVVPDHRRKPTGPLLGEEFMRGGSHAGCYETSLVMAAAPELVRMALLQKLPDNPVNLPGAIKAGATDFLQAGGPEAYFGAPATATPENGDALFETIVEATVALLR